MITDKDKELLEAYILDKTSEVEKVEIESRLNSDQEYKNEYQDLLILSNSIENFEKYLDKKKLLDKSNFLEDNDNSRVYILNQIFSQKMFVAIAASVLFFIGVNKLFFNDNLELPPTDIKLYGNPFISDSARIDSLINDSILIDSSEIIKTN